MIKFNPETWTKSKMCIQDVFMHKHNVAESIDLADIDKFKKYCKEQLSVLRSISSSIQY